MTDQLQSYHVGALEMLRAFPVAAIPTGVCNPQSLVKLRRLKLIEESGIPGFWAITDEGRALDLDAAASKPANTAVNSHLPATPPADQAASLMREALSIDRIIPGDEVFGKVIRQSTMDALAGRSSFKKFVYLSYPAGFAMKYIAWAVRESGMRSGWGEHDAIIARRAVGLPATRMIYKPAPTERELEERALRVRLIEEGMENWEIDEYFGMRQDGRPVL